MIAEFAPRHKAVDHLELCARNMTYSFSWSAEHIVYFFTPFVPGKYGQSPSAMKEAGVRILKLLGGSVLIIPGFLFWAASPIPRNLSNCMETRTFTYLRGNPDAAIEINAERKYAITVFTLNGCILPIGLSQLAGLAPVELRLSALIEKIRQLDAIVLLLQEVHVEVFAYHIFQGVEDLYPHCLCNINQRISTGLNSGLMILTKLQPREFKFHRFKNLPGTQQQVQKGFAEFDLESMGGKVARVFTTHLMPSEIDDRPTRAEKILRADQVKQIDGRIQIVLHHQYIQKTNYPIIVGGDMNMSEEEVQNQPILKQFADGFLGKEKPATFKNTADRFWNQSCWYRLFARLIKRPLLPSPEDRHMLDRVFLVNHLKNSIECEVVPTGDASDHEGILATIRNYIPGREAESN